MRKVDFRATSNTLNDFFYLNAFTSAGVFITSAGFSMPLSGTLYQGALNFTTPANGQVVFRADMEGGAATMNYSIGTVSEPSTGLLGLAAAALHRRRKNS